MSKSVMDWPLEHKRKFQSKIWTKDEITEKMQHNDWLKRGGVDFAEDPCMESDYRFGNYYVCNTIEELKKAFLFGNWAIRQGFLYQNLGFINQVNGGDEWWTIKKFEDGKIVAFESMSMKRIIESHPEGYFEDLIAQLLKASKEQCLKLDYLDAEFEAKWERPTGIVVRADSAKVAVDAIGD